MPAWLLFVGRILLPVAGRAGRYPKIAERKLSAWLAHQRRLLRSLGRSLGSTVSRADRLHIRGRHLDPRLTAQQSQQDDHPLAW